MRISDWSSDVCSSDLGIGQDAPEMAVAREIRKLGHGGLVAQQRLGRDDDERLPERPEHLAAQHVVIIGRGRAVGDLEIVLGAQLQITLQPGGRSEEHTSELHSLMRISYAVFCLKKTKLFLI